MSLLDQPGAMGIEKSDNHGRKSSRPLQKTHATAVREREFFIDNLPVRDDFSRPALRHGSLNSFFQEPCIYLPSPAENTRGSRYNTPQRL